MKIVLRQDVPKLGEAGTVRTVADGFARNYLIPRGLAVVATAGEIKTVETNQRAQARKLARQEEKLQSLADRIDGRRLEFTARAGEHGRLYGSITSADVAEHLSAVVGEEIDRRKIILDEALRTVGEHTVTVHLVGRLRPQVTVAIIAEGSPAGIDEHGAATAAPAASQVSEEPATAAEAADAAAEEVSA